MYVHVEVPTCDIQITDIPVNAISTEVTECSDTAASNHFPFCVTPPKQRMGESVITLHPHGEVVSPLNQHRTPQLSILCYNARSILPKLDELNAVVLSQKNRPALHCGDLAL